MSEEKSIATSSPAKTKKNEKNERKNAEKKKNNKKRKKSDDVEVEVELDEADVPNSYTEDVKEIKKESNKKSEKIEKSRFQSKKEEKTELLKKIPETDKDGIAYTKMQIRRMLKRVKKGLAPVPTPRELDENRKNESQLRREEEELYLGLETRKVQEDNIDDDAEGEAADDDGEVIAEHDASSDNTGNTPVVASNSARNEDGSNNNDSKKKAKRNKPVPSDYICQACKNRHTPSHWIYDCPDKVTVRGANKKKKKDRGIHDPDSKKVFLSGLPFTVTAEAVEEFFSSTHNCGIVSSVRLITFKDTKRCNGQGYVSFNTEEGAKLALELSGTTIDAEAMPSEKKEKGSPVIAAERKGLKLNVSKVLNRNRTKRG